jgi:hypothetical protein
MLWRDASTPVAKVDHATGEIDGQAVRSEWKHPSSASFDRLGIRPSLMYFRARPGSKPSSPSTITRFARAGPRFTAVSARPKALIGHAITSAIDKKNVLMSTNPAPDERKTRSRPDVGHGRGRADGGHEEDGEESSKKRHGDRRGGHPVVCSGQARYRDSPLGFEDRGFYRPDSAEP